MARWARGPARGADWDDAGPTKRRRPRTILPTNANPVTGEAAWGGREQGPVLAGDSVEGQVAVLAEAVDLGEDVGAGSSGEDGVLERR